MLILRLWYLLVGYLLIDISGPSCEKLINLATARGVFLWGVRRVDRAVVRAYVGVGGLRALRPLAKITGTSLRIEAKMGLPFLWIRLMARKMLLIGSLLSVATVWYLSSFIWFVEVSGGETASTNETAAIRRILLKDGVHIGAPKRRVDVKAIEDDIMAERSSLTWASVSTKGTQLQVEYVRKVLADANAFDTSDIVAAKTGLITKLIPFRGQAKVAEGDTVEAGDLLIEGRLPPKTVEQPTEPGQPPNLTLAPGQLVRARGLIEATVYYEGYGEAALKKIHTVYTGRQNEVVTIRLGSHSSQLGRLRTYDEYDAHTKRVFGLGWRNHRLPVEILVTTFRETATTVAPVPYRSAVAEARAAALRAAMAGVPRKAKVLQTEEELLCPSVASQAQPSEKRLVRFRVVVETREAIGVEHRTSSGGHE